MNGLDQALRIEGRKLWRAPIARVATVSVLILVCATSIGGYAAATHAPDSDFGRKAEALLTGPGWDGFLGLTSLSLSVTTLLATGLVAAWAVGREFTDGTIVGLFALPTSRRAIAAAKLAACLTWGIALTLVQAAASAVGGVALGLPLDGAPWAWLKIALIGVAIVCSSTPVAWVATRWRGYLPGIGATLGIVVVTNLAAGFGLGAYLPWAIPTLWVIAGAAVPTPALAAPFLIGAIGAWATQRGWSRLELGRC